ncbi:type II toxin-antitoxin system RelE family toxin [Desulfobacter vibrioformis]|uniref:type II toxin-antitoxin system RelE family toxin n=1 Tax=Desulfobacter vibrioformis TaxID=34031 RepID=UPI0005549D94|nr:type II toxin-antitoxin system RelE/ParE family toxin [Desulfobacter vibrioformis]
MTWEILYHKDVDDDLKSVGPSAASRIIKTIDKKLTTAPDQYEIPLSHNLKNFRKLRIGDYRVVYRIVEQKVIVYVLAVGPRRDKEIYRAASE